MSFIARVHDPLLKQKLERKKTEEEHLKYHVNFGSSLKHWAGVIIIVYMLGGATIFYFIEQDHVPTWIDSLYFITLSLTTVGYGDIVPMCDEGKVFLVIYIFFGLSIIASCFSLLASKVIDLINKFTPASSSATELPERSLKSRLGGLIVPMALVFCNMLLGMLVVHYNEDLDWVTSMYWAMVTLTSVGYGDPLIMETSTRIFLIPYLVWGVISVAWSLGEIASIIQLMEEDADLLHFVKHGVNKSLIRELDTDKSGSVDQDEFVQEMLIKLGRVRRADIDELVKVFKKFDRDNSGAIDEDDIFDESLNQYGQSGKRT